MRRRVRPALVLRRAPDRFRRRVGAQPAGFVEREAEVVGERRLPGILGAVEPPLAGDVRRPGSLGATRRLTTAPAATDSTSTAVNTRFRLVILPPRLGALMGAAIMSSPGSVVTRARHSAGLKNFRRFDRERASHVFRYLDFLAAQGCNARGSFHDHIHTHHSGTLLFLALCFRPPRPCSRAVGRGHGARHVRRGAAWRLGRGREPGAHRADPVGRDRRQRSVSDHRPAPGHLRRHVHAARGSRPSRARRRAERRRRHDDQRGDARRRRAGDDHRDRRRRRSWTCRPAPAASRC